ncbi:hypothetical protein SLS58_003634 [Diplodia intermedia]|uniref:Uncharacterized protein n=1 Tax=Diplodia intermedia TaxID=856260 RepID=A0ABR3TWF6_9PEZI
MAPHPMSFIDDSDDFVILPRGCTTGRAGAMAKDPSALLELNSRQQPQAPAAYVADAEGPKTYTLSRPQVSPGSMIDDSSDVGMRKLDKHSSGRRTNVKDQFEHADPGAQQAYKSLMAKVDNAQKQGFVTTEDGKWKYDLHLVRGGQTTSLLANAVNSNANLPSVLQGNPKQANTLQEPTGPFSQADPAIHRVELRDSQRVALANHVGGVPFPTTPRTPKVLVAHEITDEERASKPIAHVISSKVCGQRENIPRFGFLIPGANGKTHLVNNSNRPVLTYRGAEARTSRVVTVTAAPVTQSPAPVPAGGANYQAPTVESVADSGDLAGLFD